MRGGGYMLVNKKGVSETGTSRGVSYYTRKEFRICAMHMFFEQ